MAVHAPALDFVRDAHAHCKFVAYTDTSMALFDTAGLTDQFDDGYVAVTAKRASANAFIETCALLAPLGARAGDPLGAPDRRMTRSRSGERRMRGNLPR